MIIEAKNIIPFIKRFKIRNKKITLVGGCFDVLHEGHLGFLKSAKREGEILILLLESDENIQKLKGSNRPKNNFEIRAKNIEALGFIDLVVKLSPSASDKYYFSLTKLIEPDIIAVTNNDPMLEKKKIQASLVGGKVKEVMKRDERFSSSKLLEQK